MSFVLILEKHPIRMSHQIDTAFLLDDFVLILEKHPIKMSYPMDTAFWLDDFGEWVQTRHQKFYDWGQFKYYWDFDQMLSI